MHFVLHLRLRQGSVACGAPMDGLLPPIEAPILGKFPEFANDAGRVLRIHGKIRIIPLPENPQPLELLSLNTNESLGIFPTAPPDLKGGELGFFPFQAFVHLMLNG